MNLRQPGIGEVLGHGQGVLVTQQFTVAEDEGEPLGMGLVEAGAEVLGGHGCQEVVERMGAGTWVLKCCGALKGC
jgi:hypothetical protein